MRPKGAAAVPDPRPRPVFHHTCTHAWSMFVAAATSAQVGCRRSALAVTRTTPCSRRKSCAASDSCRSSSAFSNLSRVKDCEPGEER